MTVRTIKEDKNGIFFITFTCINWIPLFKITDTYCEVVKWLNSLSNAGQQVIGYVIMPNLVHAIIRLQNSKHDLQRWVSNGKRFIAYAIVRKLKEQNRNDILQIIENEVSASDKQKGKVHQVFEPSFDGKAIYTIRFMLQKLSYIHSNPMRGKWQLADINGFYRYSSAYFYETGIMGEVPLTHYKDIKTLSLIW